MSLGEPPAPERLREVAARALAGTVLHRVWRRQRLTPWWFASAEGDGSGGRFDLPPPDGACYLAVTAVGAVLETFTTFGEGLLPESELRSRARAEVTAPAGAPDAAALTAATVRRVGATAELWAGSDRRLTQSWASAFRRAGWSALHHGIAHDPSGRQRAVTLFDRAGEHPPYDDADGWSHTEHALHDDDRLAEQLTRWGLVVTRDDVQLPVVPLDDSGLLD